MRYILIASIVIFFATVIYPVQANKHLYKSVVYLNSVNAKGETVSLNVAQAQRRAFVQTLIKLTGDLNVNYFWEVESLSDSYIAGSIIKSVNNNRNNNPYHIYTFNPKKVNAIIKRTTYIIWPLPRPTLALFLRMNDAQGNMKLIDSRQMPANISEVFLEVEYERGVAINFLATSEVYRLYIEKQLTLGGTNFFQKVIEQYGTAYTTIISIDKDQNGFDITVDNQFETTHSSMNFQGKELKTVLYKATNAIINQVHAHDTQKFQENVLKHIVIKNINTYQQLLAVEKEIKQIRSFLTLEPVQVKGKDIMYRIEFLGKQNIFFSILNQSASLKKLNRQETFNYLVNNGYINVTNKENISLLNNDKKEDLTDYKLSPTHSLPPAKTALVTEKEPESKTTNIEVENYRVIVFDYVIEPTP